MLRLCPKQPGPLTRTLNLTHPIIAYSILLQDRQAISYLLIDYFMRLLIALPLNLIIFQLICM